MIGNKIKKLYRYRFSVYTNKQTNVYTNVIEISVILIKQSLYD